MSHSTRPFLDSESETWFPRSRPRCVVQDQFFDFASTMVNTGPDAFFARIGRSALVNTMVLPGASYGLKRVRLLAVRRRHLTDFVSWTAAQARSAGSVSRHVKDYCDLLVACCHGLGTLGCWQSVLQLGADAAACVPQFAGPLLGLDQVPNVVLSPVIGIVTKAARALTPW